MTKEQIIAVLEDVAETSGSTRGHFDTRTAEMILMLMGQATQFDIVVPDKLENWARRIHKINVETMLALAVKEVETFTIPFDVEMDQWRRDMVEDIIRGAMKWCDEQRLDSSDLDHFDQLDDGLYRFDHKRAMDVEARGHEYSWIDRHASRWEELD